MRNDVKQQNALNAQVAVIHEADPSQATAARMNTRISSAVTSGPARTIANNVPGLALWALHKQSPANGTPRIGSGLQRIVRRSNTSSNQDGGLPTWIVTGPGRTRSATAACPSSCASVAKGMTTKAATRKPMSQPAGPIATGSMRRTSAIRLQT